MNDRRAIRTIGGAGVVTGVPSNLLIDGFIGVIGNMLVDKHGDPWLFAGYTNHTAISSLGRGDSASVRASFKEAKGYGANTIITILCHLSQWKKDHNVDYDPRRSDHQLILAQLFDIAAEEGLRVAPGCLADAQGLSVSEQRQIVNASAEVAYGRWNVTPFRLGNEGPFNGWQPDTFTQPNGGGVLMSKGSPGGDKVPYTPVWHVAEYESRRDLPKALLDANCLEIEYGGWDANPTGIHQPILNIEPAYFNDTDPDVNGKRRWTDPKLAYKLGVQIGVGCAGGGFGATNGQVNQPLGPVAATCAKAFYAGLYAGWGYWRF